MFTPTSGNYHFVFSVYESVSFLRLFVLCFIFHYISEIIQYLPNLFHLA